MNIRRVAGLAVIVLWLAPGQRMAEMQKRMSEMMGAPQPEKK